jgi:hypothetical protein
MRPLNLKAKIFGQHVQNIRKRAGMTAKSRSAEQEAFWMRKGIDDVGGAAVLRESFKTR